MPPIDHRLGIDHRLVKFSEFFSKIKKGQVVAEVIEEGKLKSYLVAARATGFKVEVIADEEEGFPYWPGMLQGGEAHHKLKRKGFIGVSIEKPEAAKNHFPFWDNLRTLESKKA